MRWLALLVGILLGCEPPYPAADGGAIRDHRTLQKLRWNPRAFPIRIVFRNKVPEDYKEGLIQAADYWCQKVGAEVFALREGPVSDVVNLQGAVKYPGYVLVEYGPAGIDERTGYIRSAYASLRQKEGIAEIHSVIVRLGPSLNTPREIFQVSVHELGHALGLDHDPRDLSSIMWFSATLSPYQDIQQEDLEFVKDQMWL